MQKIFVPLTFGTLPLKNRLVMAPMSRCRADPANGNVTPEMILYYAQRAKSAALILTESLFIDSAHNAYIGSGGMATAEHATGWREVVEAVHAQDCAIFAQLYHPGRILHPETTGAWPIGPSPIACEGKAYVKDEYKEYVLPREMTLDDIETLSAQFEQAAMLALDAGFDGVELHAGHGYLLDQFLRSGSNARTDVYGGTMHGRARFLLEVFDRVARVFTPQRVGVKLTFADSYHSMHDEDPLSLAKFILEELGKRKALYVQLIDANAQSNVGEAQKQFHNCVATFRDIFPGFLITNGSGDLNESIRRVCADEADLLSVGVPFISNPDIARRLKEGLPLARADSAYFYRGGSRGYTDYPEYGEGPVDTSI